MALLGRNSDYKEIKHVLEGSPLFPQDVYGAFEITLLSPALLFHIYIF
jgi:hypothetical protein